MKDEEGDAKEDGERRCRTEGALAEGSNLILVNASQLAILKFQAIVKSCELLV